MIPTIVGNLLDFPDNLTVVAHGCNTLNTMGAGLAKQFRSRYPEVYEADTKAHKEGVAVLGGISTAVVGPGIVINLYQQDRFGHLNMLALEKSLLAAVAFAEEHDTLLSPGLPATRIGIPYQLGCGLARGSWPEVLSLLHKIQEQSGRLVLVKLPDQT